jgi:KaiC/GvpD/RAD55 family RecA-like ATPase
VGSAGSGKTLMALNFMRDGFTRKLDKDETPENMLWVNLEGDMDTLKFASRGFKDELWKSFRDMLTLEPNKETGAKFDFIDFPPINLDLNKIVYTLEAINNKAHGIDRLVIDSITELERAKGAGQPAVKVFLAGLIQFLRDRNITTIFVCRFDAFFRSIDKIEEQVSSLVDLIICIRNFDIHNQIEKGIYIQKARGRYHNSKIMRLHIDSKQGINIEDSGWDLENLLAGDTSFIQNPNIFFKLFYESPAEEQVNKKIIADFNEHRYPGDEPKFTLVKMPSIYTEFWSFRGQFSAGHANTRILSIPDYVISAFRDNTRLASLDKYVKSELLRNIESEKHLILRYPKKEEEKPSQYMAHKKNTGLDKKDIDAVPCYRDYGVMVFRKRRNNEDKDQQENGSNTPQGDADSIDPMTRFETFIEGKLHFIGTDDDEKWKGSKYVWKEIRILIEEINKQPKKKTPNESKEDLEQEIVPFAFPPLDKKSEFVAFFMELLWSHGGDIFKSDVKSKQSEEKTFRENIKDSVFLEFIYYCSTGYSKEEILLALKAKKAPEDPKQLKILDDFEKRFITYGLESKKIEIEEFKDWLVENLDKTVGLTGNDQQSREQQLQDKSKLVLYDEPFKETIRLMLRLVYRAGVSNPVEGEFRHRAILSRNWYSRIFLLKKEKCKFCDMFDNDECLLEKKNKDQAATKNGEKEMYYIITVGRG